MASQSLGSHFAIENRRSLITEKNVTVDTLYETSGQGLIPFCTLNIAFYGRIFDKREN